MELVDSGIKWLGSIPEHWTLSKIGHCFNHRNEIVSDKDFEPLSVTKNGVLPQLETAAKSDNSEGRKLIRKGDFVINQRSDRKGSAGISDRDGSCSVIYTVLEPIQYDPRYAHHLFRSESFQEEFYRWGTGIVDDLWSTRYSLMKQIACPVPPLDEQKAIADFLDRELGQIDSLLAKQSELANLLDERFQANLKKLVIDFNNLDRKEATGLWEPTLPRTWSTVKLGLVASVFAGGTPSRDKKEYWEDGTIPWINSGAVNQRFVETPSEFISQQGFDNSSARWIEPGSLVMALAGQGKTKGMVARVGIRTTCNQSMAAITFTDSKVQADFAYWYLLAHYKDIRSLGGSDLRDGLNLDLVSSIKLPVPPNNYQDEVSSRLFTEWNRKELLIDRSLKMIDYLNQRKQALINAAVTGKLDIGGKN